MSQPTLLVLAAGMGRRCGGLKQMEAVGSRGVIYRQDQPPVVASIRRRIAHGEYPKRLWA